MIAPCIENQFKELKINLQKKGTITLTLMKLTEHSVAMAHANKVFPVPGAPYRSTADLILIGHPRNNSGY